MLSYSCSILRSIFCLFFFFFNDTATTEIYTLSLHDALPIFTRFIQRFGLPALLDTEGKAYTDGGLAYLKLSESGLLDRKSTRLNSSHLGISYAVFCLKKKKKNKHKQDRTLTNYQHK